MLTKKEFETLRNLGGPFQVYFGKPAVQKKNTRKSSNPKKIFKAVNKDFEKVNPEVKTSSFSVDELYLQLNHYTITEHYRNAGVIGEESLVNLVTIALSNKMNTIIEGSSGSGKTFIADTFLNLLPENQIYEMGLSSEQAYWRDTEAINSSWLIYIPEFQKIVADSGKKTSGKIEFVKNLGEGKGVSRIVTDRKKEGVVNMEVTGGKTMLATTALENNFKYDRETQRRFLILETDNSPEHIKEIIDRKVYNGTNLDLSDDKERLQRQISNRINYVRDLDNTYVINPFLNYLKEGIPAVNKVQSYFNHYTKLFDSWGKFFFPERKSVMIDGKNFVLPNLEDAFNIHNMYYKQFIKVVKSFNKDIEFKGFEPDWESCYKSAVNDLENNCTIKLDNRTVRLAEEYPDLIDSWTTDQIVNDRISTIDYKTGNEKIIADFRPPVKLLPERCNYESN